MRDCGGVAMGSGERAVADIVTSNWNSDVV